MPLSTFDLSLIAKEKPDFLVGVDEAGRGPLAGPVVACAAHIPPLIFPLVSPFINDSKKLTPTKREAAFSAMLQAGVSFGFGWAAPEEIDRCNILEATFNAMGAAVKRLARTLGAQLPEANSFRPLPLFAGLPRPFGPQVGTNTRKAVSQAEPRVPKGRGLFVLVDGPHKIKRLAVNQKPVICGDSHSLCVAAASIFAKVLRDRWMARLEAQYPGYGFAAHKGYGTAAHLAALRALGPSPVHRFSFAPVKEAALSRNAI